MSNVLSGIEPQAIWSHFSDLNAVPRPSKKEERVIQFMMDFGAQLNLPTFKDSIGNVIIKKPATSGMENRQTVILQSHLDMVHQKNNDTQFNFEEEGIKMMVNGDWIKAEGTTLGADNGLGVAAIMALLSSTDIPHPALEAMFTIDEETGMTGAKELDPSFYEGTILLNLDTEDDDELSIGCAGGIDTNTSYTYEEVDTPEGNKAIQISVKGLMGGHSGMDIDKGRANANKLITRILSEIQVPVMLHSVDGGSLRNAIPREADAVVSASSGDLDAIQKQVAQFQNLFASEFGDEGKLIRLETSKVDTPKKGMNSKDQKQVLSTLYAVYNGVFKMSLDFDNLVETSSSLARVIIANGQFETQSLQRSSIESTKRDIANTIRAPFDVLGAKVEQTGDYPGWEPNPNSAILAIMQKLYVDVFNEQPNVMACHAGLECGILGKHLPNVDMISFGPNIRHAHSPDECVQISSVQKFWKFLKLTLENIPMS